jgi:DNA-cytosine methyltransferase
MTPNGHASYSLSDLDLRMVRSVPAGGNWKDIPPSVPSKRLDQIRASGGRTTLYGRMKWSNPSYTITTYFNRPGNGCYIHPERDRVITSLEAARLQSFPDTFEFVGSKTSRTKQIGNAVPPLLAYAVAKKLKRLKRGSGRIVDLFSGAGGLSLGFHWAGWRSVVANDFFQDALATYALNFPKTKTVLGDINDEQVFQQILNLALSNGPIDFVIGGPPCQGFSHAGKRMIDDPRNSLYKKFVQMVEHLKPEGFVMENVEGIISINNGKTFDEIQETFTNLGYVVQGAKLLAANYGVPQLRKRVFIIGLRGANMDLDWFPKKQLEKDEFMTVRDAIGDLPFETNQDVSEPVEYSKKAESKFQHLMRGQTTLKNFFGGQEIW